MKLLPSLRQKKRYVVFEIISDNKFSVLDVYNGFQSAVKDYFGQLGLSKASPLFIKERFNIEKQRFVVKVNNKFVDELKSALTLNKSIKNKPVIIKSIITSGTLKKANTFLS
jgi:ribonuclease P/MRP protein subunit POP5